jgi:tetratricopeptide (TPR) repeat protein
MAEAWLAQHAGRIEDAIKVYQKVVEAEPELAPAWEALAGLLYRRTDLALSLAAYTRVSELLPMNAEALVRLGSLNLKMGRRDAAQQAWEKALLLDPGNALVRKNLSVLQG